MSSFYYLATPYSKLPNRIGAADMAARLAGVLTNLGYTVFSPIVHSHLISRYVEADPRDSAFWVNLQLPFIAAADGMIIGTMLGWRESDGISEEAKLFATAGKLILYMDPTTYELTSTP